MQAAWRTDEIRRRKPTPLDEMLLGLAYVTELFDILPQYMRRIDSMLMGMGQPRLPLDTTIVEFGSWMGGDRDGNPNVKPQTTRDVVITSRLAATNLYMDMVYVRSPSILAAVLHAGSQSRRPRAPACMPNGPQTHIQRVDDLLCRCSPV